MEKYDLIAEFEDGTYGSYEILARSHKEAIERTLQSLGHAPDWIEATSRTTLERVRYEHGQYTEVLEKPHKIRMKVRVGDAIDVDFGDRPLKVDEGTHALRSCWRGYTVTGYELVVDQVQAVQSLKLILVARTERDN